MYLIIRYNMIDFECPFVDFGYDKTFKTLNPDTCSPKSSCFSPPLNSMKDGVPMFNKSAESESEIEYLNTVIRDLRSQINVLQHEAQKRDLNDFECQKQLISCQRVILECKEKEIKSLKITQNSCELRTFLCDSGSQAEKFTVQPIATSTPWSQTPLLRMSEINEPRVKFNLTNSDQILETITHVSETQSELEGLRELRHNSPASCDVISDS